MFRAYYADFLIRFDIMYLSIIVFVIMHNSTVLYPFILFQNPFIFLGQFLLFVNFSRFVITFTTSIFSLQELPRNNFKVSMYRTRYSNLTRQVLKFYLIVGKLTSKAIFSSCYKFTLVRDTYFTLRTTSLSLQSIISILLKFSMNRTNQGNRASTIYVLNLAII